jgi:hypothetical protein
MSQAQFKPPKAKRVIRYASNAVAKAAGDWVTKTYRSVLKKLKD